MTLRVAVVGAGVAGLGVLNYLVRNPSIEATLFDPKGIGRGASGVSTGLLHPFPAKDSLRSWRADEGMDASCRLLQEAEDALGQPVCAKNGLLKLAVSAEQRKDFLTRAQNDSDAVWVEDASKRVAEAAPVPALWIPKGITVYSSRYLEGLWKAAEKRGALRKQVAVRSLAELDEYDAIILATGAETLHFPECSHLPLKITKGQTLICRWPEALPPLPCGLLSQGHITATPDASICQLGSTYERQFTSLAPDPHTALPLLEKAALFYPPAQNFEVLDIRSGARISPRNGYRPIVEKVSDKAWVFTGLGSRGLLYHALLGKELAEKIGENA